MLKINIFISIIVDDGRSSYVIFIMFLSYFIRQVSHKRGVLEKLFMV